VRLLLAAAAAVFLCGCEVYAVPNPPPCPGTRQGIFDWGGTLIVDPLSSCFFAQPGQPALQVNTQIAFQGAVNFALESDKAWVCVERAHAEPRVGTYFPGPPGTGLLGISVEYTNRSGSVGGYTCPSQEAADDSKCVCPPNDLSACSCPVIITESIGGFLTQKDPSDPKKGFSSFAGEQLVIVKPPDGPVPVKPCSARVVCSFSYSLDATEVGAR